MAQLISIQEAANRLGVSRQTIMNWAKRRLIKLNNTSKEKNFSLVDWETLEPLCGTVQEMLVAKEWFELKTKDYNDATRKLEQMIKDTNDEIIARKRFYPFLDAKQFYLSIPKMLQEIGVLNAREANVVTMLIDGKTFEDISEELYISRERVRQIFAKAIRKSTHIAHLKEDLDAYEALKKKYTNLQESVKVMEEDVKEYIAYKEKTQGKVENAESIAEEERLLGQLATPMNDFDLSVRTLNCLRYSDIKTLGELVRLAKSDVMKIRNFGRKSLTELDDLIEELGLQWGMDVDLLYRKNAMRDCFMCEK